MRYDLYCKGKYLYSIFLRLKRMDKNFEISLLLDTYGDLLTEHQCKMLKMHFDEDLSLGELSEIFEISRQGVRDALVRGEQQLRQYEETLHVLVKEQKLHRLLSEIMTMVQDDTPKDEILEHLAQINNIAEDTDGI